MITFKKSIHYKIFLQNNDWIFLNWYEEKLIYPVEGGSEDIQYYVCM